jgi:hypothetical protein
VPDKRPDFADIYGVAAVLVDDAHGAPRRCAVVQERSDYVTVLGRTTQVANYDEQSCLLSDAEPSCGLDKPGMYSTRHKHSVSRPHFNDERRCGYYGTLNEKSAARLREYWERQLGY